MNVINVHGEKVKIKGEEVFHQQSQWHTTHSSCNSFYDCNFRQFLHYLINTTPRMRKTLEKLERVREGGTSFIA